MRRFALVCGSMVTMMIIGFVPGSSATAEDYYWQADPTGDWSDPLNWLDSGFQPGEPTSSDYVYINNGGTAEITEAGEECAYLTLGQNSGESGTVEMSAGDLSTSGRVNIGTAGSGTFNQTGGTNTTAYTIFIGSHSADGGAYNQSGGINTINDVLVVRGAGRGTYNLSGTGQLSARSETIDNGTFNQTGGTNTVGRSLGVSGGTYNLSAGDLSAGSETISYVGGTFRQTGGTNRVHALLVEGWPGTAVYDLSGIGQLFASSETIDGGTFNQTGGTNAIDGSLIVRPVSFSGHATYNLANGTLTFTKGTGRKLGLGREIGVGTFNLGDASGTGIINEAGAGDGIAMNVRDTTSSGGAAAFRGWGTVGLTGGLVNNGRIIADGYGIDRTLDLSSFAYVMNFDPAGNVQDDGTLAGWVAQDHGKLVLPPIDVSTGTKAYNWGEHPADGQIDLVNSVRMELSNVTSGGDFSIELLAADRTDLPGVPEASALGLWDFIPPAGFAFDHADLTFRYDDALAASLGLNENELAVYHFTAGSWVDVTTAIDTTNKWLHADGMTSFSTLAVGVAIPEPGTLSLLSMGAVALLAYTWRSRKRPM